MGQTRQQKILSVHAGLRKSPFEFIQKNFRKRKLFSKTLDSSPHARLKARTQCLCTGGFGHQLSFTYENIYDIFPSVDAKEPKNAKFSTSAHLLAP